MHLGNVLSALLSYLSAKRDGGSWLLRIEDLDPQRCREEYARTLENDLRRLGLDWDEGGLDAGGGLFRQSHRSSIYEEALAQLSAHTYPCFCSRADLLAANAPHESDGRVVYPGTCRRLPPEKRPQGKAHSTRLVVPDKEIRFTDKHYGPQSFNLACDCGDFILKRSDGVFAYQLTVVVDDALMGVTQVVRGRDLLLSTAQQLYLYDLLGFKAPDFYHTPLLCAADGRRLCKRDASLDLGEMLKTHSPQEIIGIAAHLAGIIPNAEPCTPVELISVFDPDALPIMDIGIGDGELLR